MTTIMLHGAPIVLPDPLTQSNGERVETAQIWREKRRPELLELFRQHIYGRAPVERPADLRFETEVTPGAMDGAATRKQVTIRYSGSGGTGAIHLALLVPAQKDKPAPCFVLLNNRKPELADPTRAKKDDFWPAETIVARGYAAAVFQVSDLAPDNKEKFRDGALKVFDAPGERADDAWGAVAAWAWGATLVMDYLQTDSDVDARRVAVVGHSRGGKAALWAGAQDERFALVISNDSGSTGAALARGKKGETVANINHNFPYWFCVNYKKFDGKEDELPIDQHELLALIAPRLLCVASASNDDWADPAAEFQSAVAATPVYKLFGLDGVIDELPPIETPLHSGHIGHHIRKGGHDLTRYDWDCFLNFADRHLK